MCVCVLKNEIVQVWSKCFLTRSTLFWPNRCRTRSSCGESRAPTVQVPPWRGSEDRAAIAARRLPLQACGIVEPFERGAFFCRTAAFSCCIDDDDGDEKVAFFFLDCSASKKKIYMMEPFSLLILRGLQHLHVRRRLHVFLRQFSVFLALVQSDHKGDGLRIFVG